MFKFFEKLLDFIYLKRCYICSTTKTNSLLCEKCKNEIEFFTPKPQRKINDIDVYSVGLYTKNLQKLIRGLKFHNKKILSEILADILFEFWQKTPIFNEKFTLICVPLHKNKQNKRKYNQVELIQKDFAKLCNYKINNSIVKRIKDTKPQYKLNYTQRQENLHNAFEVDITNYKNENLLILDDIITTGATISELTKALKSKNISKITVLTIASTQNDIF